MTDRPWLFGSFFLGGFECAAHLTADGRRVNQVAHGQHDSQAAADYALCRAAGIRAVREAANWPFVDRAGVLDLDGVRHLARLGRAAGLTLIWDLLHYGYPDDLDPFHAAFTQRFAAYAGAVARVVRAETPGPTYYTPINEISYTAWAADVGHMAPCIPGCAPALRRVLAAAAIAATNAIWDADPAARMVSVEPLVRQHAPPGRPELQAQVDAFNRRGVTEVFDLLAGRQAPELGGSRRHLGIPGVNYYSGNQWIIATPETPQRFLGWDDAAWLPLSDMLADLEARYGGPVLIAENGAIGETRPGWLAHLAGEAEHALARGVDLQGICWYPIVSPPDWEDPTAFFEGGLFDVEPQPDGRLERAISVPTAIALRQAQVRLDPANLPAIPLPPAPGARSEPPLQFARPLERARLGAASFSYQTLFSGDVLQADLYGLEPGFSVPAHRHAATEHVLLVIEGEVDVRIGERWIALRPGEIVLVPAGLPHGLHNASTRRAIVQQISAPKAWDARFGGPHPSDLRAEPLAPDAAD